MVTPVPPGTAWAGLQCSSVSVTPVVAGGVSQAMALLPSTLPERTNHIHCASTKNHTGIWWPQSKGTLCCSTGETPFPSTDKSGKAQGFSGITVSIYTLSLILWCTRPLHRVALWWRTWGLQTPNQPARCPEWGAKKRLGEQETWGKRSNIEESQTLHWILEYLLMVYSTK